MVTRWFEMNGFVLCLESDESGTLVFRAPDDVDIPPIILDSLIIRALRAASPISTAGLPDTSPIRVALARLSRRGSVAQDGECWRAFPPRIP